MILSKLILPSRINQCWKFSGLDHIDLCFDKDHFLSYPYEITYNYNSRGFRDQEWPESIQELQNAIWCIGDSFTVGVGSPVEHTWPGCLSKITGHRVINVSMDGASNEWISRTAEKIIQDIKPRYLTIMWSYTHRRECTDSSLDDERRRRHFSSRLQAELSDSSADWKNFLYCKEKIDLLTNSCVQFLIPDFHHDLDIHACWNTIQDKDWPPAIQVDRLDIARDGHHFDLITAEWVATRAADRLGLLTNSKS